MFKLCLTAFTCHLDETITSFEQMEKKVKKET